MRRGLLLIAVMYLCTLWLITVCKGEITLTPGDVIDNSPPVPIVATSTASKEIPQGAIFEGGWEILSVGEAKAGFQDLKKDHSIGIWATPGKHEIKFSGLWVHIKEVTFKDGDGNTVTIQSYLGHGTIKESKPFEVKGGTPEPGPNPPPGPVGPYQIVFYYKDKAQLSNMPQEQQLILNSLAVRERLRRAGHDVLEILDRSDLDSGVAANLGPFISVIINKEPPLVAFTPKEGGYPVVAYELPKSIAELESLLANPEPATYFKVYKEHRK